MRKAAVIPLRRPIAESLDLIEATRVVVDARLDAPARWRGPLRKPSPRRRVRRVGRAFNRLTARIRSGIDTPMTPDELRSLHRAATGGGEWRTGGARVGAYVFPHRTATIPGAVATALERAADGVEPPALAAARLHLELMLIHPFPDGNGRTARLAAAWVLLRAGHRSTLLTAVEQHVRIDPHDYVVSFDAITTGGLDTHRPWLRMALGQMVSAAEHAVAYRRREEALRAALTDAGVDVAQHERLLVAHDLEGADIGPLSGFDRWSEWIDARPAGAAGQIRRLLAEERSGPRRAAT